MLKSECAAFHFLFFFTSTSKFNSFSIGAQLQKASRKVLSCDEDSNESLSPGQPVSQNCPLDLGSVSHLSEKMSGSHSPSPTQVGFITQHFLPKI